MKRDIRNAKDSNKFEFREGDGFIRKGSRNPKMKREDFEIVYKKKYGQKDRKNDISATPFITPSRDDLLEKCELQCLDVNIENRSKKSIEFDELELIVSKNSNFNLLSEFEARKVIKELSNEQSFFVGPGGFRMPSIDTDMARFNIDIKENDDYYSVRLVKLRTQKSLLTIAQESVEESVFGNDIILFSSDITSINGEIIIKSNDFTEGAFRKEFELNLK